jgi:ACS family sodium-dependent inorganic phosphate cotransporter
MAGAWLPFWIPVQVKKQQIKSAAPSPVPVSVSVKAPPSASGLLFDKGFSALIKRKEVWAICAAQYCSSWGMYGLLNWLPTFFSNFYKVQLSELGSYTLLPYIVQGGLGVVSGIIAGA